MENQLEFIIGQIVEDQQAWKDTGLIVEISPTEVKVQWITINARDSEGFFTWIDKENFDLGYKVKKT